MRGGLPFRSRPLISDIPPPHIARPFDTLAAMTAVHEDIMPGAGLSDGVRAALRDVLGSLIMPMFKSQEPWALMGSTASVLQGLPDYSPPDIDLATTRDGAYIMSGAIGSTNAIVRPVKYSSAGPYTSHFGIFEVGGVKVEVMGDLVIHCADGEIKLTDHFAHWSDKVRVLHFEGMHVPVVPLEWQIVANALLGRPERVNGTARYLLETGFDRPYLETVLEDHCYGDRTHNWVREVMQLDA